MFHNVVSHTRASDTNIFQTSKYGIRDQGMTVLQSRQETVGKISLDIPCSRWLLVSGTVSIGSFTNAVKGREIRVYPSVP